jgi:hypothetical protein
MMTISRVIVKIQIEWLINIEFIAFMYLIFLIKIKLILIFYVFFEKL